MKPLMQDHQIKIIENELLNLNKSRLLILEWGCGGSTVYFTDFLKRNGISYTWISIEHNPDWHMKVSACLSDDKNVSLHLFDLNNDKNNYVNFPLQIGKKFDFILVDGRKRKECLIEAARLLNPCGVVILHDAQRSRYHGAFKYYPDSRFIDREVWRGTNKKISLMDRTINKFNYIYFRLINFLHKIMNYKGHAAIKTEK